MKFNELKIGQKFTSAQGLGANVEVWTKTSNLGDNNCVSNNYGLCVCGSNEELTLVEEPKEKVMKKIGAKIDSGSSVTVFIDGQMYSANSGHLNYVKLREALEADDGDAFLDAYTVVDTQTLKGSGIEIKDDSVYFNGKVLHNTLCNRLLALVRAGKDVSSLTKFLENLMKNPSAKAITELYDFLENKCLPITDDGHFLGYKSVGPDFWSKRGGTLTLLQGREDSQGRLFNGIGEVIECPRNEVDDERDNECSYGLHVGGLAYSGVGGSYHSPGDKCLIVKVNPADVIAVPRDYNAQKLRACKYEVVSEFVGGLNKPVYEAGDEYIPDDDYTEEGDYEWNEYVEYDELEVGDCVSFGYKGERRFAEIMDFGDDFIHTKLLAQEEEVGDYRNFKEEKMSNIKYVV